MKIKKKLSPEKKKLSLRLMAALLCCVLIVAPMLCSVIYLNTIVSARLENTARETASFYMEQFAERCQSVFNMLRSSIYYLVSDGNTQRIMHRRELPSQLERLSIEEGLSRALLPGGGCGSSVVTGIYLVRNGQQYLSMLRSSTYPYLGTAVRIKDVYKCCGGINSARELYILPEYPGYCYCLADYIDLGSLSPIGKIIFELDARRLVNTDYLDSLYKESVVLLRSTDGNTVIGSEMPGFRDAAVHADEGFLNVEDKAYYHSGRRISAGNVQAHIFVPKREIFEIARETVKVYVFFTVVVLLFTLALGALLLHFLFRPLQQMVVHIDRMAGGDLSSRMPPTPYSETEHLSKAFNRMADRLEKLFAEVYEKGVLLRDAEFHLLESQIRPHFIFNVLELIHIRCLAAGQNGICRTVSNLASLLRANIAHRHEQTIPLEEELRYVQIYLELQKERFEDKLNYSIELEDPAMLSYYLPTLTIQPLVENSLVHGLENKRGGGTVQVSVWEEEDTVCIRVKDDGIGFDSEKLALDAEQPAPENSSGNHIALSNISRRLQLLYGKPYGMQISSTPGEGTEILLTLPVDRGPQEKEGRQPDA